MGNIRGLRIGSKIQLAIATNVILAIIIGEFVINHALGLSGATRIVANLMVNGVIAFIFGLVVSRAITRPLKDVVNVLHVLAQGKGDLTYRLNPLENDEIGELSRDFNTFLEKLHNIISEVYQSTLKLARAAEEMKVITDKSEHDLQTQQNETDQAATAMQEMTHTIHEIARHAAEAEQSARKVDEDTHDGANISSQAREGIDALVQEIENAAVAIEKLSGDVNAVGMILDVIKGIAEQTNLLSLNAAIEAARAGEQGRGFAVVADEVRTLAKRTHDSTQEIRDVISRLQDAAEHAVATMKNARERGQDGAQHVTAAYDALNEIAASVKTISEMNTQIASAAEQQRTTTEEVSRSINSINDISRATAEGAHQTTATSRELFTLSQQLGSLVGQFKLDR